MARRQSSSVDEGWSDLWRDYLVVSYLILLPGIVLYPAAERARSEEGTSVLAAYQAPLAECAGEFRRSDIPTDQRAPRPRPAAGK
jgi:hypothetical protein